jgi:hypothetical protein
MRHIIIEINAPFVRDCGEVYLDAMASSEEEALCFAALAGYPSNEIGCDFDRDGELSPYVVTVYACNI